ncbi:sigma-70 family RNA polymerase sigma factor [Actinomadura sp. NAK00032]|uniref:RNA polymerase sigma factor n=1 Tax=Actinomadura sp. NAK00032 TaxID=2742128 RepID=UPI00158FF54A|nr:sigma-70 family RNA polymerase sigma factor [Actinomadura sp. NAK00032]QKW36291.1 sigma-70 family RNA polymerase sigma factor [Actinomadura sp. NAK00032]
MTAESTPDSISPDRRAAEESFALFYQEHRSITLTTLRVLLSGTGIDSDDIAQVMWTQLWGTWRKNGPVVEAPKAYVVQCARHAAIDALRKRGELLLDPDDLDRLPHPEHGSDSRSTSPEITEHDLGEPVLLTHPHLIAAVRELTPTERLVLLTWATTEPSPNATQIAQQLKMGSPSTVRVHRRNALRKLRAILGVSDGQEGGTHD